MEPKLPHYPRIFSASLLVPLERLTFFSLIVGLFAINLYAQANLPSTLRETITTVLRTPNSAQNHEALAEAYRRSGLVEAGKRELLIAQSLGKDQKGVDVLGIATQMKRWEEEPQRVEADYRFWQRVADEKPNYRDAYVTLVRLAYARGEFTQAKDYLARAHGLDPDNAMIEKLEKLFEAHDR